ASEKRCRPRPEPKIPAKLVSGASDKCRVELGMGTATSVPRSLTISISIPARHVELGWSNICSCVGGAPRSLAPPPLEITARRPIRPPDLLPGHLAKRVVSNGILALAV